MIIVEAALLVFVGFWFCSDPGSTQTIVTNSAPGNGSGVPKARPISDDKVDLSVEVTDIKRKGGELMIMLYTKETAFPDKFSKADYMARISPGTPTHIFKGIKPGKYSIVVVHDVNKNKKIDKTFIGMPKEPIGLSNYETIGLGNRPNFKKSLVTVAASAKVKIKLNNLGG